MINKDFFNALNELEAEKKINKEQFIETLEAALTSAYKKMYGEAKSAMVKLNPEKNTIRIYSYKTIVEEVTQPDKEVSLEDAKLIKKSYKVGDTIMQEESTKLFGRVAAQTAQQVVMQKLKEMEKELALKELAEKQDEILTVLVKNIDKNIVYVKFGESYTEGIMFEKDQIPGEKFNIGDKIRVYVKKIDSPRYTGPQIQVSRANNGFIRKLFELEIPEVRTGEVIIKNIAREAGKKCKVAVYSTSPYIDAIGACLGPRGNRLAQISNQINGEKIELVQYSEDALDYIAKALSPATILSVETNESLRASRVVVPDDQYSLAIGKNAQNVRLASRLTGWRIDIKSESMINKESNVRELDDSEFELTELVEEPIDSDLEGI